MRVALVSDTHINITTPGELNVMFRRLAQEQFDVLVHAGDYCGGTLGHKSVTPTVVMMRKYFPNMPIISVLGNHDLWCYQGSGTRRVRPTVEEFEANYSAILDTFRTHSVHFLDTDGPYSHPEFPLVKFMGCTGWYAHPAPPTNDELYLPHAVEYSHTALHSAALQTLYRNADLLDQTYDPAVDTVVFVTHFPVRKPPEDTRYDLFSWSEGIGDFVAESYNCKYFLNGHAHMNFNGPLRYESGSDYRNPKYNIIEVN